MPWRETFHEVPSIPAAHIRFRRSEAPPPFSYAITLELMIGDELHTVRLWDNADGLDEHHEHAYTCSGGKQDPVILEFRSTNEAMAAAIDKGRKRAGQIVRQWSAS
ncbi:MAG TPA: hypothetical protein VG898_06500 [Solirubrobacterales bacterium]|nr:hypothetical protein [Solirubrobacterales bacterium]